MVIKPTGTSNSFFKERLKKINDAVSKRNRMALGAKAAEDHAFEILQRRMEDLADRNARRLFTTHPHAYGTGKGFKNGPYRVIFLHAIGMHINNPPPAYCVCSKPFSPDHPHCCVEIRRKAVTDRHDSITSTFGDICPDAGCQTSLEPKMRTANQQAKQPNVRADIRVTTPDGKVFSSDTSVIHTTAETYTKQSVKDSDQLEARANTKISKYAHLALSKGQIFYPFILTSMGTFHDKAIGLLTYISKIAKEQGRTHCAEAFLKQSINCLLDALHRGNVHLLQYAFDRIQLKEN